MKIQVIICDSSGYIIKYKDFDSEDLDYHSESRSQFDTLINDSILDYSISKIEIRKFFEQKREK